MATRTLPRSFISAEVLNALTELLLQKEALRRVLVKRNFGRRVMNSEEANRLLQRITDIVHNVLNLNQHHFPPPKVIVTGRMSQLPHQTINLYKILVPISLVLLAMSMVQTEGERPWIVVVSMILLLILPLIVHRRIRLQIEHDCHYIRTADGREMIILDQLPSVQFQSYLAHEYAHHLYFHLFDNDSEEWVREGWARLVQWKVMEHLYLEERRSAYLVHALDQIVGELKFACELISGALKIKLPSEVRSIRTMYHTNPLYRFFTGTPGFNPLYLIDHAVGTASYFLGNQCLELKHCPHQRVPVKDQLKLFKGGEPELEWA